MTTCPTCHADVRDGARYCPHCATQLIEPERVCPDCGAAIPSKARFCRGCGKAIQAAPKPPASAVSQPAQSKRFCTACGKEISRQAKFCPHCRAQLASNSLVQPPVVNASAPALAQALPVSPAMAQLASPPPGPAAPSTGKIPTGTLVNGRYAIQAVLGIGGMGAVYLALDNHLNTPVALKEMSDSHLRDPLERQKAVDAFRNEATLLSTLCHPNLPRVMDFFSEGGNQFLVMDYVPGQTLAAMLENRSQPFDEAQVLVWAGQLCDVLHYLHTRQPPVIFRDLKPGNVMISPDGRTAKLIDFGIVRLFRPGASKDTMTLGTPGYAPPEQYGKAQTDARSDVFALGALLHHLLTLRDPATEMFKFPPVRSLNASVSPAVETAIHKAVRVQADARWANADEFKTALLGQASGGLDPAAAPGSSPTSDPFLPPILPAAPVFPPIVPPGVTPLPLNLPIAPGSLSTAGLGPRLGAYILDMFILGLVLGVVAIFISGANVELYNGMPIYLAIAGGSILGYFSLFHATSGQTPGKKSASLKVVRMDGSPLGFVRALWRALMMIVPASLISAAFGGLPVGALLWLVPLFNQERRALHDYLSDTRVVKS